MRIILEYNEASGTITDKAGTSTIFMGLIGFEPEKDTLVLDMIKQGVTPDEIIKLKNNDLL